MTEGFTKDRKHKDMSERAAWRDGRTDRKRMAEREIREKW